MSRVLYLHGIASGPDSPKGVATQARLAEEGIVVERLDLRPLVAHALKVSDMISAVRSAIGDGRVVLMGASLGALTAARTAAVDDRVDALVLLAPAIRCAARWREKVGEVGLAAWERTGFHLADYPGGRQGRLAYDFYCDACALDAADDGFPVLRLPTLVIHGSRDEVVDLDLVRTWTRGKTNVRLVEVDDDHQLLRALPDVLDETTVFLSALQSSI